jgi:hypothetical protein
MSDLAMRPDGGVGHNMPREVPQNFTRAVIDLAQ